MKCVINDHVRRVFLLCTYQIKMFLKNMGTLYVNISEITTFMLQNGLLYKLTAIVTRF